MANRWVVSLYKVLPRSLTSRIVRIVKPTFPIGVVAVVFDDQHRVLLFRHTYHNPPWRLPGGLMERNESPEQTAVRELREEGNCVITPLAVFDAANVKYSFDVAVLGRLQNMGTFYPNTEVSQYTWAYLDDLPPIPDSQIRFIRNGLLLMENRFQSTDREMDTRSE